MEKSEPALVPQWLRSAGSASGGGSSANHAGISSSHSDASIIGHNSRNRTSRNNSNSDSLRSGLLDRSYSANSRRGSSNNGFAKNPYSSFSRSHRDRDREKEKEMKGFADRWDFDYDPLGNNLFARLEKDKLRRSNSVVLKKQGEVPVFKGAGDSKSGGSNTKYNGNGLLSGTTVGNRIQRSVFDKDFPVLGSEEKQAAPDIGRVSSPVLGTSVQSLPVGSSALIGGEGWSSALAEVPKIIGTNSTSSSSAQTNTNACARSGPSTAATGLNMAEALTQPPARAGTPPESSVTSQKLEELAIKQSRQLIPVTPSMPKISASSSSDKLKPKIAARTGDLNMAGKNNHQQPSLSHPSNQSLGSGHIKSDAPKKFLVLKPGRENGVLSSLKDVSGSSNSTGDRVVNSTSIVAPIPAPASSRSPRDPKVPVVGNKATPLAPKSGFVVEKKPSSSQAKSRNDFFNLMRKKSLMATAAVQDSLPASAPGDIETSGEANKEMVGASESDQVTEDAKKATTNSHTSGASQRSSQPEAKVASPIMEPHPDEVGASPTMQPYPDEEEAAFLRSLGWEENAGGEDEGLTEEEINSFYEFLKLNPSPKLRQEMQMRLNMVSESHGLGGTSSFSSPDSRSRA